MRIFEESQLKVVRLTNNDLLTRIGVAVGMIGNRVLRLHFFRAAAVVSVLIPA